GELTARLGIDRSSVFRLAQTLRRRGFLACPAGRKDYVLGPAIWRLAHRYNCGNMLIKVSHEHLKLLAAQTRETAHLAVREGKNALLIDHAEASHLIVVAGQTGESACLHFTAHGKALLADSDEQELMALLGPSPLPSRTKKTITSTAELAQCCAAIRQNGFALDDEEYQEGLRCIAAPIRAEDGAIVASIGISAPISRFPLGLCDEYSALVCKIAEEIGALLSTRDLDSGTEPVSEATKV
ncbi:MAG: IclR family transcriptional regulator, partial [Acidobacteria bacterium]|nr:IclR family transcriptional regulator [Acidobacteriota bacterium]